jgi:hypothetical protein
MWRVLFSGETRRGAAAAVRLAVLVSVAAFVALGVASGAQAATGGRLTIVVHGLPGGSRANLVVIGHRMHRRIDSRKPSIGHLRPGRYTIDVREARIRRSYLSIKVGATAYPAQNSLTARVRRGRDEKVVVTYATIVNPHVEPAPAGVLSVLGNPDSPSGLVYRTQSGLPRVGTTLTAGQSSTLPYGLIATVTSVSRSGSTTLLAVTPVPLTDVIPVFSHLGSINLALSPNAPDAKAGASDEAAARRARDDDDKGSCNGPSVFNVGAQFDQFQIRNPTADVLTFHPYVSFTLALRTTESLGLNVAAAGVSCSWDVTTLGPWETTVDILGIPIPFYASIPIEADASIGGSLSAFTINLASTHAATIRLGSGGGLSFQEQGANVWTSGILQLTGSADVGVTMNLELGVGDPDVADVHVDAGVGAEASWQAGSGCDVDVHLGSFSAGAKIGPISASTPTWTARTFNLWHGCTGSNNGGSTTGGGNTGGGNTGNGGSPTGGTGGSGSSGGTGPGSGGGYAETTGGPTRTFTDYSDAGGTQGSTIPSNDTVDVACRVQGFAVSDGNTWWYQIASSPWGGSYYASADAFYNNGDTSGSLQGTPWVDASIPVCAASSGGSGVTGSGSGSGGTTYSETTGSVAHTWTDYSDAGGTEGPSIASNQTVQIACRVQGFAVADGNTWWYQIASSPWSGSYYVSADAFYNNGSTSGSLIGTPFYDPAVAVCGSGGSSSPPPPQTWSETDGPGGANTWTDYADAGGTAGTHIPAYDTVQIACKVTGFKVQDGNTWWYRIASSPWSNAYYVSADAFYNNGETSGTLKGTPWVDPNVPNC